MTTNPPVTIKIELLSSEILKKIPQKIACKYFSNTLNFSEEFLSFLLEHNNNEDFLNKVEKFSKNIRDITDLKLRKQAWVLIALTQKPSYEIMEKLRQDFNIPDHHLGEIYGIIGELDFIKKFPPNAWNMFRNRMDIQLQTTKYGHNDTLFYLVSSLTLQLDFYSILNLVKDNNLSALQKLYNRDSTLFEMDIVKKNVLFHSAIEEANLETLKFLVQINGDLFNDQYLSDTFKNSQTNNQPFFHIKFFFEKAFINKDKAGMINILEYLLTFPFILEKEKISLNGEIKQYVVAWENKQNKTAAQERSDASEENKLINRQEDSFETFFEELKKKINLSILGNEVFDPKKMQFDSSKDSYLKWMSENTKGIRLLNRFTHLYHGKSGEDRAKKVLRVVNSTPIEIVAVLNAMKEVFEKSSYTTHSLRHYFIRHDITADCLLTLESWISKQARLSDDLSRPL